MRTDQKCRRNLKSIRCTLLNSVGMENIEEVHEMRSVHRFLWFFLWTGEHRMKKEEMEEQESSEARMEFRSSKNHR